ncbi:MAG: O-antigen ligase family protein [Candidatus Marinarcus sp.]|uniref:O-antigen ligase family protein n=1 Tax=Candidatus Marinarcus sp. TaxID=3100987 RepID=UPI003AFF710F
MRELITVKNFFNVLLFIWVIFIPFKNAIYQISTILLILFFIVYVIKNKDIQCVKDVLYKYKDIFFAFALILLSMTISNVINDVSNRESWRLELSYVYRYGLIMYILLYFYSKEFFSKRLLFLFVLSALSIQALDGLYQSIMGYDFFKHNIANLRSGLKGATFNRNTFGFFMGVGVILSFYAITKEKLLDNKKNLILISLFVLFIYCTLFSYSRAIWVALTAAFLIFTVLNYKNIKVRYIVFAIIILSIVTIIFFNVDYLGNRLEELLNGSSSHREQIWLYSIEQIKKKPIFGWGLDASSIYGLKSFFSPHNIIIEILFDLGWFGFMSFFLLLIMIVKEILKQKSVKLFTLLVFFLVASQFDQSIISGKIFINSFVLLGLFVFIDRIDKIRKINNA